LLSEDGAEELFEFNLPVIFWVEAQWKLK
jgi:hypothetical protein